MSTPVHSVATHGAENVFIQQDWSAYSPEQHQAWSVLYERRIESLRDVACRAYLEGTLAIGLSPSFIPELAAMNAKLRALTGWSAVPVSGFLDPADFFASLAQRRFPTTVTIRALDRLDYVPEPDIFHDVFGHVPMHADPVFADFLQRFGELATRARTQEERRALTRLFWFTVEFGLVQEHGRLRVYGSGLISSQADCAKALGPECDVRPFHLDDVLRQEFSTDELQGVLFVISSFDELFAAVQELEERMRSSPGSGGWS
jgi:phenylalanine-4-hydroxylase